ncbi:MAG: hypothetical protein ACRC8A_11485 [Microcoleaceae cyanobacterium]
MNIKTLRNLVLESIGLMGLSLLCHRVALTQANVDPSAGQGDRQAWCRDQGGTWINQKMNPSCQWANLSLPPQQEIQLGQACSDQNGIWQTLVEEVYTPQCSGDVCLPMYDPLAADYVEKGITCIWYSDIEPVGR